MLNLQDGFEGQRAGPRFLPKPDPIQQQGRRREHLTNQNLIGNRGNSQHASL